MFRSAERPAPPEFAIPRLELVALAFLCVGGAVGLNFALGRDLNWDFINYHGYAAVAVLQDRVGQDFWASGVQTYLNPLPFLPFALMQKAGWHSLGIASALAAWQALSFIALYIICRCLAAPIASSRAIAMLMTALGVASPVVLSQIGSTFIDALTAPLVMFAVVLLVRPHSASRWLAAAFLCGAAAGLKWTNAPFALGILAAILFSLPHRSAKTWLLAAAGAGTALAAGIVVTYGWWGLRLWQEYGSALFPLFNGLLRAPDAPLESATYLRYVPQTLGDLIAFPFRMALHEGWVHTEVVAPDLRPGALVLAAAALLAVWGVRRVAASAAPIPDGENQRACSVILAFFTISTVAWIITSSNGRYAVPLMLLLGPLIVLALMRLLGSRTGRTVALLMLVLQTAHAAVAGSPRWTPQPWTASWMPVEEVPAELRDRPHLYVLIGAPAPTFVAAVTHPSSAFVNPIGAASIPSGGPGWSRLQGLLDTYDGRTRVLVGVSDSFSAEQTREKLGLVSRGVDRLGLRLDTDRCDPLRFNTAAAAGLAGPQAEGLVPSVLLACVAVRAQPDPELSTKRRLADTLMNSLEARCPQIFAPRGAPVEGAGRLWTRAYARHDIWLTLDVEAGEIHFRQSRQLRSELIGRVDTWAADLARFECRLPLNGRRGIDSL